MDGLPDQQKEHRWDDQEAEEVEGQCASRASNQPPPKPTYPPGPETGLLRDEQQVARVEILMTRGARDKRELMRHLDVDDPRQMERWRASPAAPRRRSWCCSSWSSTSSARPCSPKRKPRSIRMTQSRSTGADNASKARFCC